MAIAKGLRFGAFFRDCHLFAAADNSPLLIQNALMAIFKCLIGTACGPNFSILISSSGILHNLG